jgi:hypothetical protein
LRSFGNAITNANSHGRGNSNCYSHSHGYAYGKTQSLTATTPDSGASPITSNVLRLFPNPQLTQ